MEPELLPLSEAKTRLHEVVRDAEERDLILLRHGRPVGVLIGFRRYRGLLDRARRGAPGPSSEIGLLERHAEEVARICRARGVRRLAVFGSTARGEADPRSDVDLLVEFSPMSPADRADAYFGLQSDLERLFGRSVDLLEESAITNPYLERAIARDRAVVYEAA